jgi:tetratricopeptide (TPR) repeat protein
MTRQPEQLDFGRRVREARIQHGLTQVELADLLGISRKTVQRWENSPQMPRPYLIPKLETALGLLFDERDQELSDLAAIKTTSGEAYKEEPSPPLRLPLSTLPPHNPYFTGREEYLARLSEALDTGQPAALTQPRAISGLGGIGKTQIALAYAYRYRNRYPVRLWINAATQADLVASFVSTASLLPLSLTRDEPDSMVIEAVKQWLEQTALQWLLIFDNADEEIERIHPYFPQSPNGDIIVTTRTQAIGPITAAEPIEVTAMEGLDGVHLLLRRAHRLQVSEMSLESILDKDADLINEAENIAIALDYFPLALDQAGAYIEETQCSLSHYLQLYQTHSKVLHARRGQQSTNYPHAVATTWSLSFQKVEQAKPAAAELLRLCAFLAPDAIPEELIRNGASHWSDSLRASAADPLAFDQTIADLLRFSLVKRSPEHKTLSIHRLVQAVVKDMLELDLQRTWAEGVIRAVNDVVPFEMRGEAAYHRCLRYLDQVQVCESMVRQYGIISTSAVDLLNQASLFLGIRANMYAVAEALSLLALAICEREHGLEHPDTATTLNGLARVYKEQRQRIAEAEAVFLRALAIREQRLGPEHPDTASTLDDLAGLYRMQGRFTDAEPLYRRALAIREQRLGSEYLDTATTLNSLAKLYKEQGRFGEAEPLFLRALAIFEQHFDQVGPETINSCLKALAQLYDKQERYAEAEAFFLRALAVFEREYGPADSGSIADLMDLVQWYDKQERFVEAELCCKRVVAFFEQHLGSGDEHLDVVVSWLHQLAGLYEKLGRYAEAEPLYQRMLALFEREFGPQHPDTMASLSDLAYLYNVQGKHEEAEPLVKRLLAIQQQQLGPEHPDMVVNLNNLAFLYKQQGQYAQAEQLYQRAIRIQERTFGMDHLNTAMSLVDLGHLYADQGKYEQAEPLFQRALAINERQLGASHPDIALSLNNLAELYQGQGREAEAEPLYRRALAISEAALGRDHPLTRSIQTNYGSLLKAKEITNAEAVQQEADT